jgi:predicted 3-demethylubiquinone-9 3-methyltransferase (glyoxalase superfamily)
MARTSTYLNFPRQTEEAFLFYKSVFGGESKLGWLKDKYGVSWQVVPAIIGELFADPQRAERVMEELLKMRKLNIEILKNP